MKLTRGMRETLVDMDGYGLPFSASLNVMLEQVTRRSICLSLCMHGLLPVGYLVIVLGVGSVSSVS